MSEYFPPFPVGSQSVELKIKKLPISYQKTLKTLMPEDARGADFQRNLVVMNTNDGRVENSILVEVLEELRVNGVKVTIDPEDPLKNLTDYGDEEFYDNIDDEIMKRVVKVNGVLWRKWRFARVFGIYKPEDEEQVDPTPSGETDKKEDTSTSSASSTSVTPLPSRQETPGAMSNPVEPGESSSAT